MAHLAGGGGFDSHKFWIGLCRPGSGCKKHLKNKKTRNYYFKTISFCSRKMVKSPYELRKSYLTL